MQPKQVAAAKVSFKAAFLNWCVATQMWVPELFWLGGGFVGS